MALIGLDLKRPFQRTASFFHCIDVAGLTTGNAFHEKIQVFNLGAGVNDEVDIVVVPGKHGLAVVAALNDMMWTIVDD